MQSALGKRFAILTTALPLPCVIVSLVLGAIRGWLDLDFLQYPINLLLICCGICYPASLVLTLLWGLTTKSAVLLFTPVSSLILITLFVLFLPDNIRENPWRAIDIFIFAGLVVLNLLQYMSLRRRTLDERGR